MKRQFLNFGINHLILSYESKKKDGWVQNHPFPQHTPPSKMKRKGVFLEKEVWFQRALNVMPRNVVENLVNTWAFLLKFLKETRDIEPTPELEKSGTARNKIPKIYLENFHFKNNILNLFEMNFTKARGWCHRLALWKPFHILVTLKKISIQQ